MGNKKNENAAAEPAKIAPPQEETKYSVDEYVKAAEAVFGAGTSPDIVRAAFKKAGKNEAGISEAKKLVEEFANKEVK